MARKRKKWLAYLCYTFLVLFVLFLLIIHTFKIIEIETGYFTRFMIILLFVLLLLPLVSHIKFFDIIDVRRDLKLFRKKK